uniref:Uncharacterized protein n=1 Tax=Lactuca sativa TaxID=4236 RepID=A0A9R1VCK9_LACSA|nr:hypothetical protein LSAT_V11C500234730 [Lactuca sativa]
MDFNLDKLLMSLLSYLFHNMKTHKTLCLFGLLDMSSGVLHFCPCYTGNIFTGIKLLGNEKQTRQSTTTTTSSDAWNCLNVVGSNVRVNMLVDHFKMVVDCFFVVWFVVGNVWIFGEQSYSVDAPNLYRLSIVFLAISCIGYAMPFILCGMICCCFPCIVFILGIREDMNQIIGATSVESDISSNTWHATKIMHKSLQDTVQMKNHVKF